MGNGTRQVVIATGGEWPAGLALLRGLRLGGFDTVAAFVDRRALSRWSRAPVARAFVTDAIADPEGHAAALAELAAQWGAAAVLPGTEASLVAVAENADMFGAGTSLGCPSPEIVHRATDKRALADLAGRAGLKTPPTEEASTASEFSGPFPAIIKPSASVVSDEAGEHHQVKVSVVANRDELSTALEKMPGGRAVVQPYIAGRLRTVNGVAWEGQLVCSVHKRSDRTWPLKAGVFSYGTTVAPDLEFEEACQRLLQDLAWSGLFNLQFLETASGERLLIDVNPRAYHSMALAIGAGANLPAVWCDLLTGRPPRHARARAGVRFRSEAEELRALSTMAREGHAVDALLGCLPRRRTVHAVFSFRDPGPIVSLAKSSLRL